MYLKVYNFTYNVVTQANSQTRSAAALLQLNLTSLEWIAYWSHILAYDL